MDENKNNKNGKISYILTKETIGMTLLLFSAIVFVMLVSFDAIFAGIGAAICTFMYGTFGYGSWLVVFLIAYLGEWLTFEKKMKIPLKKVFTIAFTAVMLFFLFHAATSRNLNIESYGSYISECYTGAVNGWSGYTFGGLISALLVYPVAKFTTFTGAYIIFSVLSVFGGALIYVVFKGGLRKSGRSVSEKVQNMQPIAVENQSVGVSFPETAQTNAVYTEQAPVYREPVTGQNYDDDKYSQKNLGRKILFEKGEFAAESYRRNMIFNENSYFNRPVAPLASEADYLSSFSSKSKPTDKPQNSYSETYQDEVLNRPAVSSPSNYVYGEKPVENLNGYGAGERDYAQSVREQSNYYHEEPEHDYEQTYYSEGENDVADDYSFNEKKKEQEIYQKSIFENDPVEDTRQPEPPRPYDGYIRQPSPEPEESVIKEDISDMLGSSLRGERRSERSLRSNSELFDDGDEDDVLGINSLRSQSEESQRKVGFKDVNHESITPPVVESVQRQPSRVVPPPVEKPVQEPEKPKHVWKKYVRPTLDLLKDYPENANVNTGEIEDSKRIIVETLENFKISSSIENVTIGPAITRYDVIIEDKTNIKRSLNYRDAIAMALKKENVTAYLNYAKGALSIDVPNSRRTTVGLKGMLASPKFINCKPSSLTFALGKNVEGEAVCPDITKMPHLLVAGTTGSGKSICLSTLLISLLYKYGPEDLRLILVDPKEVEFIMYDKLPHLMVNEIISEVDKAVKALNWAIDEMKRRYSLFKEMTESGKATKNLDEYNMNISDPADKLPKIVIILDEFGDLMLQAKKDIEGRIIKLAQKSRACGIHLILATQRPSVDCITGLIKSNLPTRIGFKVNSFDDSRTIFDIGGAEKLLGEGDMYFRSVDKPDLVRIKGCFIDTPEVQRVTDYIKENNETYFDQSVSDFINKVEEEEPQGVVGGGLDGDGVETKIDDTFIKALKYCVTSNQASVSMIQRRFPVGYIKACKIIDWMENMNYVTQSEGSKPRKVLLTKEEFVNIYGDDVDD